MKISTGYLKDHLIATFQCTGKSVKRTSKSKNEQNQVVRKFTTDKGSVIVVTDSNDENIISCELIPQVESNGFYFCYDPEQTKEIREENEIDNVSVFLITPIKYFDETGYLDDRGDQVPLDLLEDKFGELMESVYETELSKSNAEAFLLSKGFIENKKMLKCGMG